MSAHFVVTLEVTQGLACITMGSAKGSSTASPEDALQEAKRLLREASEAAGPGNDSEPEEESE